MDLSEWKSLSDVKAFGCGEPIASAAAAYLSAERSLSRALASDAPPDEVDELVGKSCAALADVGAAPSRSLVDAAIKALIGSDGAENLPAALEAGLADILRILTRPAGAL